MEEGLVERKHKNVVEEDIEVVSTKISRLLNFPMVFCTMECTLKIKKHLRKASEVLSFTRSYSKPMNISP